MASRGKDKGLGDWLDNQDVIVALMFDKRLGTARFQNVKHKASSNAFPYIDPHYSAFTLTGIGINQRTDAKIQLLFGLGKILYDNSSKNIIFQCNCLYIRGLI